MARPAARRSALGSRDRLLSAAAREFAAHGYAGASVDRIARTARLNKAMIYYHFTNKAGLYRTIVKRVFESVLASATLVADAPLSPPEKVRRFVQSVADVASRQPHFPPIWLREFSLGAANMDRSTLAAAGRVVATLGRILAEGQERGIFRPANPVLVHIGIVAPLLLFLVSEASRKRLTELKAVPLGDLTLDQVVRHVADSTLGSLRVSEDTHA